MKNRNLSVSDLVRIGGDTLTAASSQRQLRFTSLKRYPEIRVSIQYPVPGGQRSDGALAERTQEDHKLQSRAQ
jgi:hypothetical protein